MEKAVGTEFMFSSRLFTLSPPLVLWFLSLTLYRIIVSMKEWSKTINT